MRVVLSFAVLVLAASPAWAAEAGFEVFCRTLPDAQVIRDVEYQPGVDVTGKPVVPADLNALSASVPDIINVPITVDLASRFSLLLGGGVELKPDVGMMSIHKDGRVSYNGQDISRQAYTVCAKNMEVRETVLVPAGSPLPPGAVEVPAATGSPAAIAPASGMQEPYEGLGSLSFPQKGQKPSVAPKAEPPKDINLPVVPKIAVPEGGDAPGAIESEQLQGQYP